MLDFRWYQHTREADMVGRRVVTVAPLTTGALAIPAGASLTITGKRSGLNLRSDACPECGVAVFVRKARPSDVALADPAVEARTPARGRDARQSQIVRWVTTTFGPGTLAIRERVARFVEEALELAQAFGFGLDDVIRLAHHVYGKPAGDPQQEAGGVGVTLLALTGAAGFSADEAERREVARVLAKDVAHFRARHNAKADAGVAVYTDAVDTDDTATTATEAVA